MNPSLGSFYAILAAASYGLMSYLVHANPHGFPVEQMSFVRGLVTFLVLLPFCRRDLGRYFAPGAGALWLRAVTGAVGVLLYFYTLQGTVSANANFFFSCSPVFVWLLSALFFRERLSRAEASGVALIVLAGVLLYLPNRSAIPPWVWLVGLAGAFNASIAFLSLGSAARRYSSSLIVTGFAAATSLLALAMPGPSWRTFGPAGFGYLLAVGTLGLSSQFLMTLSFAHLKNSVATALGRTSILFAGLLDIGLAGYRPHPLEWVSYFVVIAGVALTQRPSPARSSI